LADYFVGLIDWRLYFMVVDYTAGHIREVQYENQYEKT